MGEFKFSDKDITITVYGFLSDSKQYIGSADCYIPAHTGLPEYCTQIKPPEVPDGQVAVFDETKNQWKTIADHRGETVYSIATGSAVEITGLGEIQPELTPIKPTTPYDKWDGEKWITDTAAQHAAAVAEADAQKSALLDEANVITADWRTELALGIISDNDKAKLVAWMKYIRAVKASDTSAAPNVDFPPKPE